MLYRRSFPLQVITPTGVVFEGEVYGVRVPGSLSPFEVLGGHTPLVSSLEIGEARLMTSPTTASYVAITGGVIQVRRDGVTMLADAAELVADIDGERAEQARERALERLRSHDSDVDHLRAEAALARALNRLSILTRHPG